MGYLEGSKSFRVSKAGILKIIPKCLVLNIGLKTAVCDGLGKFKSQGRCWGGGRCPGRRAGRRRGDTRAACPGHGPVVGT